MKLFVVTLMLFCATAGAQAPKEIDPGQIEISPYRHERLPAPLLPRIRATTDTFEPVDGISYEQAIDLYRRDANPETNLVLYEEMARVYREFCKSRCKTQEERVEVYQLLLLRTMYTNEETIAKLKPKILTAAEAAQVVGQYKLVPKPIDVYKKP